MRQPTIALDKHCQLPRASTVPLAQYSKASHHLRSPVLRPKVRPETSISSQKAQQIGITITITITVISICSESIHPQLANDHSILTYALFQSLHHRATLSIPIPIPIPITSSLPRDLCYIPQEDHLSKLQRLDVS